ncbi:MAG TPA: hypothetical protein ENK46_08605 [Flavobacteriia bacterium]|nr:hypothetical protein [Flavobacteriia bacterium]
MSKERKTIVKEYSNSEITIIWKPEKCIHAGECVKRLPKVYRPRKKPWLIIENATTEELKSQIEACPSGALSYNLKNQENQEIAEPKIKVTVLENGPLLVEGALAIAKSDGTVENKTKTTAFCRCGASANKPYCDGEHKKIDFKG